MYVTMYSGTCTPQQEYYYVQLLLLYMYNKEVKDQDHYLKIHHQLFRGSLEHA